MNTSLKLALCLSVFGLRTLCAEPSANFDGAEGGDVVPKVLSAADLPSPCPVSGKVGAELDRKGEILDDRGTWAELVPQGSVLAPEGVRVNHYYVPPGATIRWTLKCPNPGDWTARKTYELHPEQLGGHYHFEPLPPLLEFSSVTLLTSSVSVHAVPSSFSFLGLKGQTTYYYWEKFPAFATRLEQKTEAYGACLGYSQIDYIVVAVQGLGEMPFGENYLLADTQDAAGYHPDSHYGSQKLMDTLRAVADSYRAAFPGSERILYMDMSLPWGGIFDLSYNWKEPHYGHTIGADADIGRDNIPAGNRGRLLEIMCGLTPGVFLERDFSGEPLHYHLRVYGKEEQQYGDGIGWSRAVSCCKGNAVDPANLGACVSAR